MEFTLLFAAAIGVAAGAVALRWEAARGNAADCAADLWDVLISALVVGLFVGRLASMIGAGINPLTNLADILIIRGGVATGPATIAGLIMVMILARGEVVAVADALAVAGLASLGAWHFGCLARDACLGTTTDVPWAMTQATSVTGRHPVELYAAAIFVIAAIALALYRKRRVAPGMAASAALAVAGAGRLATEPFRLSLSGGPIWWYIVAIAAGFVGIILSLRKA
ncbi:MAG: hypothetical protein HKN91_17995 [Acidimicrobiia bacterium]|nr:hypothetical protein [Acidimicrobiia bacterium]